MESLLDYRSNGFFSPSYSDSGKQKSILLVEDEAIISLGFKWALSKNGYDVTVCRDGLSAVDYFSEKYDSIDLILMDINMPVMTGLDAIRRMREIEFVKNTQRHYAIAVTGHTDPSGCIDAGFDDYMKKPVLPDNLQDHVSRFFSKRQFS